MKNHLSINENKVLDYLYSHSGLTTRKAVTELNIMNVQDVILRLRRLGYKIEKEWIKTQNNKRYAIYSLETIM
jgi:predicted transcriptional regulator